MGKFKFLKSELKGAYLIKPFVAEDERGRFVKDYSLEEFQNVDLDYKLKEVFFTYSKKGVIRALHFQEGKEQQKLVRCVQGHIFDVIVDLRKESSTFGEWRGYHLRSVDPVSIFIPKGFAHGYLVLEDSIVCYQCDEGFYQEGDTGILWNDRSLAINWPLELIGGEERIIISEKDKNLQSFQNYQYGFIKEGSKNV